MYTACICVFETAEVCRMSETMSTGLGMGGSNVRGVMALSLGNKDRQLQAYGSDGSSLVP